MLYNRCLPLKSLLGRKHTQKSSGVCVQHHMFCLGLREDEGHFGDVFVVGTTPGAYQHGFSFVHHLALTANGVFEFKTVGKGNGAHMDEGKCDHALKWLNTFFQKCCAFLLHIEDQRRIHFPLMSHTILTGLGTTWIDQNWFGKLLS